MSSTEVRRFVSRLLTDDDFAQTFDVDKDQALTQFDLSPDESEALKTIDLTQINATDMQLSRDMDLTAIRIGALYVS